MSIYGHALFWSATAGVLAAVVVCTLVLRYGFTRDSDPAGRWGWRPTRAGHGLAAALFGAGLVLTILALTAVPLGGKERPRVLGDALRAQLEALRGRLGDFEDAVARFASERVRRVPPAEQQQVRGDRAHAEGAAEPSVRSTASSDMTGATSLAHGGHAVVGMPPAPPPRPATMVEPRKADRAAARDRQAVRPETRDVVAAQLPAAPPAPIETAPPTVTGSPSASTPPTVAVAPARDRAAARERADEVKTPENREPERRQEKGEGRPARPERVERAARLERSERVERADRVERPDRIERPQRIERPERIEKVEKLEKFERPERVGKR